MRGEFFCARCDKEAYNPVINQYYVMLCCVFIAMQSELAHDTLDRQNQAMTENLAMKVSRLRDVCCTHCIFILCWAAL